MCALGCRCARHIFRQWQKECCHGNGILWQKWGEILHRELLPQFFTNSHEIWHRCLPWRVVIFLVISKFEREKKKKKKKKLIRTLKGWFSSGSESEIIFKPHGNRMCLK